MCGRFTLVTPPEEVLKELGFTPPDPSYVVKPRYNAAPTQQIVVALNDGTRQLTPVRWGLIPSWAKDPKIGHKLVNARAESLAEKPSFRTALKKRRCVVIADGFYEWRKDAGGTKTPFHLRLRSRKPFPIAGLWETWKSPEGERVRSCTLVTVPPNELAARIHDRMPAMLPRGAMEAWLEPGEKAPEEALELLVPYPAAEMEAVAVGSLVNSPKNDLPGCLDPAPTPA